MAETNNRKQEEKFALKQALDHSEQKQSEYERYDKLMADRAGLEPSSGCACVVGGIILSVIFYFVFIGFVPSVRHSEVFALVSFGFFSLILPIRWYVKGNAKYRSSMARLDKQLLELQGELRTHYSAYDNFPVGFEYSHPAVLLELIQLLSSGRADDIKEAINCMLDDRHKQEMLKVQKDIADSTQKAADSASAAALFSAGTYLNTRK